MTLTPFRHKAPRLPGYDYRNAGGYFVTIRFEIIDESDAYAKLKKVVKDSFKEVATRRPEFSVDNWVLMPDHLHFICLLDDTRLPQLIAVNDKMRSKPLGFFIRQIKAKITWTMNRTVGINFTWRTNFYEHIIRNEAELNRTRKYILENPLALEIKEVADVYRN